MHSAKRCKAQGLSSADAYIGGWQSCGRSHQVGLSVWLMGAIRKQLRCWLFGGSQYCAHDQQPETTQC